MGTLHYECTCTDENHEIVQQKLSVIVNKKIIQNASA